MHALENRRGATIAVTAVVMLGTLSVIALAFDLGIMFRTRAEAQRAADAAALAGASAYISAATNAAAVPDVLVRAKAFAARNSIGGRLIDTTRGDQVVVHAIPDSAKARVWVRRPVVRTVFARLFGVTSLPVGARAAAIATEANTTSCVKPWAIPDLWEEAPVANGGDDLNANRWPDVNTNPGNCRDCEDWAYEPPQDRYCQADAGNCGTETGIGSSYRNGMADANGRFYRNDDGRRFPIKLTDPNATPTAGNFLPFAIPGGSGGDYYRDNIATCSNVEITLGTPYTIDNEVIRTEPGNMVGPTQQGVQRLLDQDPTARWTESYDATCNCQRGRVTSTQFNYTPTPDNPNPWLANPRVVIVPLYDPAQISSGRTQLSFNRFAYFFVEDFDNRRKAVTGRYIDIPVSGRRNTGSSTVASNARYLRLVE